MRGHLGSVFWRKAFLGGLSFLLCAAPLLPAQEDPVKVEASILPLRVARGEEGRIILKISVKSGFTVNSLPSFIIELDPGSDLIFPKNFFTASDLNLEVVEVNGRPKKYKVVDLETALEQLVEAKKREEENEEGRK